MTSIYPKTSAPVTAKVLQDANERADRWRRRWEAAVRDRDEAQAELKQTRESLAAARSALAAVREVRAADIESEGR